MSWAVRYPLHAAACKTDPGQLLSLIADALPLDILDEEGRAPLHYAAWNGLTACVRELVRAGAHVDVRSADRRSTPLHFAAGMGHADCVDALLAAGGNASSRDVDKWTPLDLARQNVMGMDACAFIAERLTSELQQKQAAASAASAVSTSAAADGLR